MERVVEVQRNQTPAVLDINATDVTEKVVEVQPNQVPAILDIDATDVPQE